MKGHAPSCRNRQRASRGFCQGDLRRRSERETPDATISKSLQTLALFSADWFCQGIRHSLITLGSRLDKINVI
ncbi:hypothetical protein RRG08_010901 [Elysia crispata]|uniref:Uncharacterized protein n=1 Tax=Elysia crispata TaxID=231223 RepID=A0AAE1DPZ8_9GAST|nr:hypothetical protein RRG08_010901 [Elysia crispata]